MTGAAINTNEVCRTLALFHAPCETFEIRILGCPRGVISGYFDDPEKATSALAKLDICNATGIYHTPNPCVSAALARAANRFVERPKSTTGDNDIAVRNWILIDFDPVRPSNVSSTEAEHRAAIERSWEARKFLTELGFSDPIHADSGNGAHLNYRIDQPGSSDATALIKRCVAALAFQFSDNAVAVDQTSFNAARIWKLYGTVARKGDSTPDRPHRMSAIIDAPAAREDEF